MSNLPTTTPLNELACVSKSHIRIEQLIMRSKCEAGLAVYQVLSWTGWHHRTALSLVVTWFLPQKSRLGKRMDSTRHGPLDPRGIVAADLSTQELRNSGTK